MEFVYGTIIRSVRLLWKFEDLQFTEVDFDKFPGTGGAVVAINHTGYLDFPLAGFPAFRKGRKIRFMAKKEVFDHPVGGFLMRACKHIPVDRTAGAGALAVAIERLKSGELVGVYPEATHSLSFELKGFKTGAARMALEADVPIVPVIVWGAQRIWAKGHKRALGRHHFPILVGVGDPIMPVGTPDEITATLHDSMSALLYRLQDLHGPHPEGEYWVPARLGGSAPTLEEANVISDAAEAERAAKRAARDAE